MPLETNLPSKQALRSVQWCVQCGYIVKAIFAKAWAVPQGDDMTVVIER